jgi:hypothetical protein
MPRLYCDYPLCGCAERTRCRTLRPRPLWQYAPEDRRKAAAFRRRERWRKWRGPLTFGFLLFWALWFVAGMLR